LHSTLRFTLRGASVTSVIAALQQLFRSKGTILEFEALTSR
jgi:hypothetical protein